MPDNTSTTPQIPCRCCGEILDAKFQTAIVPGKPGFHYLTCLNETCRLDGQTFTTKSYATVDLSIYAGRS